MGKEVETEPARPIRRCVISSSNIMSAKQSLSLLYQGWRRICLSCSVVIAANKKDVTRVPVMIDGLWLCVGQYLPSSRPESPASDLVNGCFAVAKAVSTCAYPLRSYLFCRNKSALQKWRRVGRRSAPSGFNPMHNSSPLTAGARCLMKAGRMLN